MSESRPPAGADAPRLSVVIPAYNEGDRLGATLAAVRGALNETGFAVQYELIVVDDGSSDGTGEVAAAAGALLICQPANRGKGAALEAGFSAARGELLMMLDADLSDSAGECAALLTPVLAREADMTVAVFPGVRGAGGFGLVARLARWGVQRLTGRCLAAPLSGQRAMTRAVWERVVRIAPGYGAEVGLDIDVLRAGFRLAEVPTAMSHKAGGRDLAGFRHRGRQMIAVAWTLLSRWRY